MSDTITYLGHLAYDDVVPILKAARIQIAAAVNLMLPELSAQLAGAIKLAAYMGITPPSIPIVLAAKILAAAQVAIVMPGINFGITAAGVFIARLQVIVGALQVALTWGMYPGSAHLLVYEGTKAGFAGALSSALNGGIPEIAPGARVVAPILIVDEVDSASLASLRVLVKVS